jgi:hypothetical protein
MHAPQTTPRRRRRWTPALLTLAVAGAMALLFIVIASVGPSHSSVGLLVLWPTATPNKVQQWNQQSATMQALARQDGPKKTVTTNKGPAQPASCPFPPIPTGIGPWAPPVGKEDIMTNVASIGATAQTPYNSQIYAGALRTNPQQGIVIVTRQPVDPCAQGDLGTQTTYDTPYQKGALTLTAIKGDSVSFSLADGGTGQFNYITNTFS